jgi:predicted enzyme related to lactoylglutathione lyase
MGWNGQRLATSCLAVALAVVIAAAAPLPASASGTAAAQPKERAMATNPISYVEIPVADMDRAVRFYEAVLGMALERQVIDGYEMALFPYDPAAPGVTAALAKGDVYIPAKAGPVVYFGVDDIDAVLARATALGGRTLYPRKDVGAFGTIAEFEDSEGNRIALHTPTR